MNFPIANTLNILNTAVDEIMDPPKGTELNGWKTFNLFTGGLRPKEFSIFCGPTGAGKTLFLANLSAKLIEQNQKIFFAPIETGEIDLAKRILSVYAKTDFTFGDRISGDSKEKAALDNALRDYQEKIVRNLVVTTYDGRVDVDELIDVLRFANDVHKANIAILDNLNFFLKPSRGGDQTLEMDETIHKFVQFVKKTPMHVILVMHPKKTEHGKIISEFDIKGSSTAVQEATNVLLMNRLTDEEQSYLGYSDFDREFVFKKIRKRGKFVNKKFYMGNKDGNGNYEESVKTIKSSIPRNDKSFKAEWGGPGKPYRQRTTIGPETV